MSRTGTIRCAVSRQAHPAFFTLMCRLIRGGWAAMMRVNTERGQGGSEGARVARHRRWGRALVVAASFLLAMENPTAAQQADLGGELEFDIPSQPLASALKAYSVTTRLELFYESTLTDGRRSSPLRGAFTPEAALRRLLAGTAFTVASFGRGTITILPPLRQEARGEELAAIKSKAAEYTPYFARIQEAIRSAFCQTPATQVDASELIVRLWIGASGAIARAELVLSTDADGREQAYAAALRTLVIGEPPPQGMPQPVTLMVLPRASRTAAECPQPDASRPR